MQLPTQISRIAAVLVLSLLAVPCLPSQAAAAAAPDSYNDDDYQDYSPPSRVGRVSQLDGDASVREASANDWQEIDRNSPLFEGDELYTNNNSRLEVQLGGGRYLRLDEQTNVVFAYLDSNSIRMEVPVGSVILSVDELERSESIEISAPSAALTVRDAGVYRVDVDQDGDTVLSVHRGEATASGLERSVYLGNHDAVRFSYDDPYDVDQYAVRRYDAFQSWSSDLDRDYDSYYADSRPYINSYGRRNDIYGLSELIRYGSWNYFDNYGYCWVPRVGSGWQPYNDGYWGWNRYGYGWVSNEPWGWAPYHYGRWTYLNGYGWAWVPWSQYSNGNYYWSPGQVYWSQYPNGYYGWVPLAPNEPYVPYVEYRRFGNRRNRDFVPVHLRNGRGIGLTQPGSNARLKPVRSPGSIVRNPIAGAPERPKIAIVRPTFDPKPATDKVKDRAVVVKQPLVANPKKPRGPVVVKTDRPIRVATTEKPVPVREVKPGKIDRTPQVDRPATDTRSGKDRRTFDDTPTMTGDGTTKEPVRKPKRDPVVVQNDTTNNGDVVERPKPRRVEPKEYPTEKPKTRRVDPSDVQQDSTPPRKVERETPPQRVERKPKNDSEPKVVREPKPDRTPKVDREQKVDRKPPPERREVVREAKPDRPTVSTPPPPRENKGNNGNGNNGNGRKPHN